MADVPEGWYPDPEGPEGRLRWWDGSRWTDRLSDELSAPPPSPAPDPARSRRRGALALVTIGVIVALAGFGWYLARPDAPAAVPTATRPSPSPSPTAAPAPAPSRIEADRCAEATQLSIDSLDTLLDRIEADPTIDPGDDTDELFTELGGLLARDCAGDRAGEAISEVLVYLADEASRRSPPAAAFADGFLGALCDGAETSLAELGVELTARGRLACLRT